MLKILLFIAVAYVVFSLGRHSALKKKGGDVVTKLLLVAVVVLLLVAILTNFQKMGGG